MTMMYPMMRSMVLGLWLLRKSAGIDATLEKFAPANVAWFSAGHGAAALCPTLVALLFQRAATLSDPGKVLAQANAGMLRILHGRSMLSAACALLLADGELYFAGAGHPPLPVRRVDGRVEGIASQGTALGVLPDRTFPMETVRLSAGDSALLFTAGLYSARRPDGERSEIEDVAPASAQGESVPALIDRMHGASAFDDEVTALSIQCAD